MFSLHHFRQLWLHKVNQSWREMLWGSLNMFLLLCNFVLLKRERWYIQSKLYTVGTCICLQLSLSLTARWHIRPQAIITSTTPLAIPSSFSLSLLNFTWRSQESLLSSPLLVFLVNYPHLPIEELTSFYSHTKDTFCHLWLLQYTVGGPFSIPWRWGNRGRQRRPRNSLPASYCYSTQLWQL